MASRTVTTAFRVGTPGCSCGHSALTWQPELTGSGPVVYRAVCSVCGTPWVVLRSNPTPGAVMTSDRLIRTSGPYDPSKE